MRPRAATATMIPMRFASRPRVRQIPSASIAWSSLLDHLIRPQQERLGDREAEGLGGLEVDDQLERRRLLDRQVARLRTLEDLVDVGGSTPKVCPQAGTVRD